MISTGLHASKRSLVSILVWLCLAGPAMPRQEPSSCGTHGEKVKEQLHLHRGAALRAAKSGLRLLAAAPRAQDVGDIAILEDSGDLVARLNPFDLAQRTVTFTAASPAQPATAIRDGAGSYDPAAAASGTRLAGLGDDDTREISLPFAFPFYGDSYQRVFVNSDGNLTFRQPRTPAPATGRSGAWWLGRLESPRCSATWIRAGRWMESECSWKRAGWW